MNLHALEDAANDLHRIADALEKIAEALGDTRDNEQKGERDATSGSS